MAGLKPVANFVENDMTVDAAVAHRVCDNYEVHEPAWNGRPMYFNPATC